LAAFWAGYQPNNMPMAAETPKAKRIEGNENANGKFIECERIKDAPMPKIMPIIPPTKSNYYCFK